MNKVRSLQSPQKEESFDDIIEKYGFQNSLSKEEEFELSIAKRSFLSIETKYLDPDAELKRIFGSAAVNVDRNNRRNQHQPRRGGILVSQARVGRLPGGTGGLGCKVRKIISSLRNGPYSPRLNVQNIAVWKKLKYDQT